jgi:hypothetical protein
MNIINYSHYIQFVGLNGDGTYNNIEKSDIAQIKIYDLATVALILRNEQAQYSHNEITIKWHEVTSPVFTSIDDCVSQIQGWVDANDLATSADIATVVAQVLALEGSGTKTLTDLDADLKNLLTQSLAKIIVQDTNYCYIAFAAPGSLSTVAVWAVKRIALATGTTTWADGNANYDNLANSLATLSYL